jgi:alkaline phosphatase
MIHNHHSIALLTTALVLLFSSCTKQLSTDLTKTPPNGYPKNIILMVGDGMGLTQVTAGMYMNGNKLNLEQFQYIGLHKSYPKDKDLITDSAAGATAFASGVKTYNAAIGLDADTLPRKTILETAEAHGLATGLVATCAITHATPAAFIAHQKHRDMYEAIASDFLKTEFDLLIGGGEKHFTQRKDNRNLVKELEGKGYTVIDSAKTPNIDNLSLLDYTQNVAYFTAGVHPKKASEGRTYLPIASKKAVNFLSKKSTKGFFMMIEGSQIDWGGHANQSDYIINEMLDFDKAIGEVLEFAKRDGNTLVIVTADHETGGYSINKGSVFGKLETKFTSDYHTGTLIPVYAYGPGAAQFAGIYENTAIFDKMMRLFGW